MNLSVNWSYLRMTWITRAWSENLEWLLNRMYKWWTNAIMLLLLLDDIIGCHASRSQKHSLPLRLLDLMIVISDIVIITWCRTCTCVSISFRSVVKVAIRVHGNDHGTERRCIVGVPVVCRDTHQLSIVHLRHHQTLWRVCKWTRWLRLLVICRCFYQSTDLTIHHNVGLINLVYDWDRLECKLRVIHLLAAVVVDDPIAYHVGLKRERWRLFWAEITITRALIDHYLGGKLTTHGLSIRLRVQISLHNFFKIRGHFDWWTVVQL